MDIGAITRHVDCPDCAGTHFADPKVMARLSKPGWFTTMVKTQLEPTNGHLVTHPGTNRANVE